LTRLDYYIYTIFECIQNLLLLMLSIKSTAADSIDGEFIQTLLLLMLSIKLTAADGVDDEFMSFVIL
jgi:hypothetical protein